MESEKKARIIRILLLIVIIVCLIQIGQAYYLSVRHRKQQEKLSRSLETEELQEDKKEASDNSQTEKIDLFYKLKNLYLVNSDLTGWLSIDGMNIDYPVVQCKDDEYYLSHNFYKEEDRYGCLYVRDIADVNAGTNFIIYGHSMKDGSMFGNLSEFQREEFYKKHPVISFDTLSEERTYDIMAVFPSQVYGEEEDVFKYYQFYQADTEEDFRYFYENVKKLSLYDTGVTAQFGDTFLTLSTCAYHTENGRFVVVAKRQQ